MKKILIITRDFPPYSGRGNVLRILKFAKYFPEFGWQPFLIAERKNEIEDSYLLEQLPTSVKIKYVFTETPQMRKNRYKELIKDEKYPALDRLKFLLFRTIGYNLYSLYQYYFMAPDLGLFWAKKTLTAAVDWHKEEKFDLFLTSGPPFSTFRIGIDLKDILNIPWVADFRDMWVGNPIYQQFSKSVINFQNLKIENKVIRKSDLVVLTTEPMQKVYSKRYPAQSKKMLTITNGYDSEDYQGNQLEKKFTDKLHFVYSGTIAGKQIPTQFFKGLVKAIEKNDEIKNQVQINFIGKFNYRDNVMFQKVSSQISLEGILSHQSALQKMSEADVFLLLINPTGGETMMTTKIFEYLAFNKLIFAVSIPCAATELIKETNTGYISDWHNVDEIANQIIIIYNDWKNGNFSSVISEQNWSKFERKNLTKVLSRKLNTLIQNFKKESL